MSGPLSIDDLITIGFSARDRAGGLVMLKAYLDDSGTNAGSPAVVIGGLIGAPAQWEKFNGLWENLLRKPLADKPPLKKWATSECRAAEGEFSNYNKPARDRITYLFRSVINDCELTSIAYAIDAAAYNELVTDMSLANMGTSEARCLVAVCKMITAWAAIHAEGPDIAIYYDQGRTTSEVQRVAGLLCEETKPYRNLVSFSFCKVERCLPLQGADMVATESNWYAQEWLRDRENAKPRAHFEAFLRQNYNRGTGFLLDRAMIERELARRNPDGSIKA